MPCSALLPIVVSQVNGQELASLDMSQWRLQLGWLSQNPSCFSLLRDTCCWPSHLQRRRWKMPQGDQARSLHGEGTRLSVGDQAGGLSVGKAASRLARTAQNRSAAGMDEPRSLDRTRSAPS